ncbi:MAG: nucleotide exchange factor GrpE [Gammaproteobacteria bacterium]|jgi:molecular chaperone GrpE|nr:nucleotide exchange factor GrpE [Gammaproteobacteria bacterium]MBT3490412.1 nucleotide exchange factor GrpE [Gammaproteobacteria bacterium]MBT3718122.1 nucleotide exchange factor GrpE [Gammaproteobacteria bacterium]MBT3845564.1 nucleotide exchange factor GrpE [Gammaproteobacteria bacterium]MBT3893302.1 nucleotide exchange factor GrpE [Gammaproteobacteria bacterium]
MSDEERLKPAEESDVESATAEEISAEEGQIDVESVDLSDVDSSKSSSGEGPSEESGSEDPILVDMEGPEIPVVDEELQNARAKAADYLNRMTRIQAEMDNLRKRTARDVEKAHKFALEPFAKELLAVADSMDLGLTAAKDSEDVASLKEGMELTRKQLFGALEKFNVEVMDAMGVKFDPEQHEALTMVPNPEMEPNTVMDVIQKGYTLNGRLLRPARVIVSSS